MKGMLTGPVTILQWSFVRDDPGRVGYSRRTSAPAPGLEDLSALGGRRLQTRDERSPG